MSYIRQLLAECLISLGMLAMPKDRPEYEVWIFGLRDIYAKLVKHERETRAAVTKKQRITP